MWFPDGLYQHFNSFIYIGDWIRAIVQSIVNGNPVFPMYALSIGYGDDVITTLSYYMLADPFSLISAFFPKDIAEIGYAISIIARLYCAGIAFCVYAQKMECDSLASLLASLMYSFCAFATFAGTIHPFFLTPMVWMPLIFLGVEKILRNESPAPYCIFIFLMVVSNYYFSYMVLILTAMYVICRVFFANSHRKIKQRLFLTFKLVLYCFLGIGLSGLILIPTAIAFFSNARISSAYQFDLLYPLTYYKALIDCLVTSEEPGYWAEVGIAPICWLGVISFFLFKKDETSFKVFFILLFIMLLFPLAGHLMNGGGYVTNRWIFAWAFWASFLFAKGFPDLFNLRTNQKLLLTLICALYCILCAVFDGPADQRTTTGCILLLLGLATVWIAPNTEIKKRTNDETSK